MKAKKNPKSDLRKNSILYFFVGMTVVLFVTLMALEWKSYDSTHNWDTAYGDPNILLEEEPPITIQKMELPKPKIQTPPIIEIADNDLDIEETPIEANEPNPDTEVAEVDDIAVAEDDFIEEISIVNVETAPIFPGCENETTEAGKKACFQEMMNKHIRKNFRYPESAIDMGLEGRVNIMFTIQRDGTIDDIKLRGPYESLENEASRIISKLPQMTPGKQGGKQVRVTYTLPIFFKIQ